MPKRADANQPAIVARARHRGATVQHLHAVGQGCPDLLVGYMGNNLLVEVKNPLVDKTHRQLTSDEKVWHSDWNGQVSIVFTVEDMDALLDEIHDRSQTLQEAGYV
jgi:hypothetical protein